MSAPRFGADRLAADPRLLRGVRRVGLVTNDAARSATDVLLRTRVLLMDAGVPITKLFSPEHGMRATAADGTAVENETDILTGLPVLSLYGDRLAPAQEALRDLDAVLFDVPAIGVRYYTYAWTLTNLIDACAAARIPVIVLDRPNPLSGAIEKAEGPILDPAHASFLGRHTVPVRHSLTLGELAMLWRNESCPSADVQVIACEDWRRDVLWRDAGLPFVPTSPAIQRFEAALFYGGLCLFEATDLSVARGTPYSFEVVGAPWLDTEALIARLRERNLPGLDYETIGFVPRTGPHAGTNCRGVRLIPVSASDVRPVRTGLAMLADVIALHRKDFSWAKYTTAANPAGDQHFERLIGIDGVRDILSRAPASVDDALLGVWTDCSGWQSRWESVRMY